MMKYPRTLINSPEGIRRLWLTRDKRGVPDGVEAQLITTFTGRLVGTRFENGERLYRIIGHSCRPEFRPNAFDIEVSERVFNTPVRLCRAISSQGIGFVIVPIYGAFADVRRSLAESVSEYSGRS
jgi:hypothetical protein